MNELYALLNNIYLPQGIDCSEAVEKVRTLFPNAYIYTIISPSNNILQGFKLPNNIFEYIYDNYYYHVICEYDGYIIDLFTKDKVITRKAYFNRLKHLNNQRKFLVFYGDYSNYFSNTLKIDFSRLPKNYISI